VRISCRIGLAAFFLFAFTGVVPARAQDTPVPRAARPYRGLFGGGVGDAEQLLTISGSVGAGIDDDVLAGSRGSATSSPLRRRGSYGYGTSRLAYSLARTRAQFGASAGGTTQYYPQLTKSYFSSYSAGVGAAVQALAHTRVSAGQSVSYQPYNIIQLFPVLFDSAVGQHDAPDQDFVLSGEHYLTYATQARLSQDLGRRMAFGSAYDYRNSHTSAVDARSTIHGGSGQFTVGLGRGLGVRLGYTYREARYDGVGTGRRVHSHSGDGGLDFNRALSLTRRTTFSFSTGTTAVATEQRTVYRATGGAQLNHELGRSWNASIAYGRNVRFIETFEEPFLYDSASAAVGGLLTRRLQFVSSVRAASGALGLTQNDNRYTTYAGTASLTVGVTRHVGIGLSYFYYRYSFGSGASLPRGIVREADRQGVRAYVTAWAPLLYRPRRSDASR
jgi:hypothetical protein